VSPPIDPVRRRAAVIATAVTLPLVVILALLLGHANRHPKATARAGTGQPSVLAPISVAAPPTDPAAVAPCTKLLAALPVQLGELAPRIVHPTPDSPFVVAWGNPAVVLRCGVGRPSALRPASADLDIGVDGVYWLPVPREQGTVWTTVDRAVYVELTVPKAYPQPPLGPISDAVAKVAPPVCVVDPKQSDTTRLCTHRK